jgi:hypothetical protein
MHNVGLILLVFAFVVACIATRIQAVGVWHLGWMALALWIASELIGGIARIAPALVLALLLVSPAT